jgi:phenylacetate-CoA ligase
MFVHPRQVGDTLARVEGLERWQLVVTRADHRDELTLRAEASGEPSTDLAARLGDALREVSQLRATVELVPSGTIPDGAKPLVDERVWE